MRNLKRKRTDHPYQFKYEEVECPICMEEMKVDSRSVTAPCMHEFCLHCIGKWLMESSSRLCPLCKQMVKKIMYSIESQRTYSIIGFPGDFCTGWTVRNKMKAVFDDFDNVLRKIYGLIKNFFDRDHCFDTQILSYLLWFANVRIRIKSRETGDEVPTTTLLDEETDVSQLTDLLNERLSMIFRDSIANKIVTDIYLHKITDTSTVKDILLVLEDYLDSERLDVLKSELRCHLIMHQSEPGTTYIEYYLPLHHNDNDAVLFTDGRIVDDKLVAALVTKVLCSCNFVFDDERMLVAHVNIIHAFCTNFESSSSYDKLVVFLSEASYFILHGNAFYQRSKLRNAKQIQSTLISNNAYSLVKHCFNPDDFNHVSATQSNFERQFIYVEPLLVQDSSDDDDGGGDDGDDSLSSRSSDNVELTGIYVEISDSDDDALELLSVQPAVFDLTSDLQYIEEATREFLATVEPSASSSSWHSRTPDIVNSICELSESSTIAMDEQQQQPCPSVSVEQGRLRASTSISTRVPKVEAGDTVTEEVDYVPETEPGSNRLGVDFIYQPRSAEDFYQYLLSENGTDP